MLAFLQWLIALYVADFTAGGPQAAEWPDLGATLLVLGGYALAAVLLGHILLRTGAGGGTRAVARFLFAANAARAAALGAFYLMAQPLGGHRLPDLLGIEKWVLLPHLVRLVPFALLVVALKAGLHAPARALGLGPPSLGRSLALEFAQAALPLGPLAGFLLLGDLAELAGRQSWLRHATVVLERLPATQAVVALGVLFAGLLALPFVLRAVWRARPLADGPLRQRLEAYARRVGFRARDILVWPSGGHAINAAVVGAFPRFRYAVLTDGLLRALSEDQIEAVFAHEAGHARRGHILLFLGFTCMLLLVGVVPGAGVVLETLLGPLDPLLRGVVVAFVWFGVVFGWVSRRFEQEADVFGVETVPLPAGADGAPADPAAHPFVRALERIAEEVGAIREVTGWRHFSIADRVDFVRGYLTDATVRRRYRRGIVLLRGSLLAVIGGFALLAGSQLPGEAARAVALWEAAANPETRLLEELRRATDAEDPRERAQALVEAAAYAHLASRDADAVRWLREAVALGLRDPGVLAQYADALGGAGRPRGALATWREVADHPDAGARLREVARERIGALARALSAR